MKIGILTFYKVINYGAILQAYALQKVLKGLGYEVLIINYQPTELTRPYKTVIFKYLRKISYILRLWRRVFLFSPFKNFLKLSLNEGKYYASCEQIIENPPEADVYIVGSDQIWNDKLTGKDDIFFLPFFRKEVKKIAYAASCGGNYSFLEEKIKIQLLKHFNAISVREKTLQSKLEKKNIISEVVLDPTLLLTDYDEFIESNKRGNYIVVYNIANSHDFEEKLAYLKKITKMQVINVGPHFLGNAKNLLGVSPSQWVNLIFHAKYVFTNSFHGVAFSINFNKCFMYIPTGTEADSRVLDLLDSTGLEINIIHSFSDIDDLVKLKEKYLENQKMINMRQASLKFLIKAIASSND